MDIHEQYDDDMPSVARSCRYMSYKPTGRGGIDPSEGVSCSICSNWSGDRCIKDAFHSVLNRIDTE